MASNDCLPQVQVVRLRAANLDFTTGATVAGASQIYVTDSLVRLSWSPVYEDGNETRQRNGSGALCNQYRSPDSFVRINLTLELCTPNPKLIAMLTGGGTLTDLVTTSRPLGYQMPAIGQVPDVAVSLEWWTVRNNNGVADSAFPYEWFVAPYTKNWRLGDRTHEDGPQLPTLTGQGYENGNWGNGPRNDWPIVESAGFACIEHIPSLSSELPASACEASTALAS